MKTIHNNCSRCNAGIETIEVPIVGGGTETVERPCIECGGSGKQVLGYLSDDLIDMLQDMQDKINDIFEKVNE